ncbi:MAG: carboxypeptidase-like regulatory domain-containing protein [Acidobacteriota bacterium]|nr:carboxypeptidase-like regulatory domain-containing protein [Acidobacteriota bacterium]
MRAAINAANANGADDIIQFASGLTTITLTDEIVIANNGALTITGLGANVFTINGGDGTNRIFSINFNATVTITGATLTGGNGISTNQNFPNRGGAIASDGNLTLDRVHITGNAASGETGGGILFSNGTNTIRHSTFSANYASSGGAFTCLNGTLTVFNTTLSGNVVSHGGAGFYSQCSVILRNVTITRNTGQAGGGLYNGFGTVNFANTIIAGNTGIDGRHEIIRAPGSHMVSDGNNLVGDEPGDSILDVLPITYQPSDKRDINPLLGALQNNGGLTPTHALLSGSPAIDMGNNVQAIDPSNGNAAITTDQRGSQRYVDGDSNGIPTVDIGAYEFNRTTTVASVTVSGRVLSGKGSGIAGAVVYLTDSDGNTRTAKTNSFGYYRFEDVAVGETYIFNVFSKRFQFQPEAVMIREEIENQNFLAVL